MQRAGFSQLAQWPSGRCCAAMLADAQGTLRLVARVDARAHKAGEGFLLPFEGDAALIACDQAAIGDGDAMGVAREVAQDLLGPTEWALAARRLARGAAYGETGERCPPSLG